MKKLVFTVLFLIASAVWWVLWETTKEIVFGWVGDSLRPYMPERAETVAVVSTYLLPLAAIVLFGGAVYLFAWWQHRRVPLRNHVSATPTERPEKRHLQTGEFEQRRSEVASKPQRDTTAADAIKRIAFGSWDAPSIDDEVAYIHELSSATEEFLQAALDGDVPVWGRKDLAGLLDQIPTDYWRHFTFDFLDVLSVSDPSELKTKPRSSHGWNATGYVSMWDLRTSKAAVDAIQSQPVPLGDSVAKKLEALVEEIDDLVFPGSPYMGHPAARVGALSWDKRVIAALEASRVPDVEVFRYKRTRMIPLEDDGVLDHEFHQAVHERREALSDLIERIYEGKVFGDS